MRPVLTPLVGVDIINTPALVDGTVTDAKTAQNPPSFSSGNLRGAHFGGIAHLWTVGTIDGTETVPVGFRPAANADGAATVGSGTITTGGAVNLDGPTAEGFIIHYEIGG